MNQQLGPTYFLSVLVVIGCAIAFYRAENPAPAPLRPDTRTPQDEASAARGPVSKAGEGGKDRGRLVAGTLPLLPQLDAEPKAQAPAGPRQAAVLAPVSPRVSPPAASHRGAFVRAEKGETLADVALRVYGSPQKAEVLWRANRDQLASPGAMLASNMLLRTP